MKQLLKKIDFIIVLRATAICLLIFLVAHLAIKNILFAQNSYHRGYASQKAINLIRTMLNTPPRQLAAAVKSRKEVSITAKPLFWQAKFNANETAWGVYRTLMQQQGEFVSISYHMGNNQWLNVQVNKKYQDFLGSFTTIAELLIIAIILVYLVAILFFTTPLRRLKKGLTQIDINANKKRHLVYGPAILREAMTALDEMQTRIDHLLKERTSILTGLTYDLQKPVEQLEHLSQNITDQQLRDDILTDTNQIKAMLAKVLIFTQQGYSKLNKTKVNLVKLLQNICHNSQQAQQKASLSAENTEVFCWGDPISLNRLFTNIINNAIKYGKEAKVTLKTTRKHIIITVADTGPGLPKAELEKVFEPFYRQEQSRSSKTGGTGLGLAISKRITFSHQGDIKLTNLPERGLLVTVTLNLYKIKT